MNNVKTDWKYMWSIVRGARQGDIYEKRNESDWWDVTYKLVLMQDGVEVHIPENPDEEYSELDHCRMVAEEFVQGE